MCDIVSPVASSCVADASYQLVPQLLRRIHRISREVESRIQGDLRVAFESKRRTLDLNGDNIGWTDYFVLAHDIDGLLAAFTAIAFDIIFHIRLNEERHLLAIEVWRKT